MKTGFSGAIASSGNTLSLVFEQIKQLPSLPCPLWNNSDDASCSTNAPSHTSWYMNEDILLIVTVPKTCPAAIMISFFVTLVTRTRKSNGPP